MRDALHTVAVVATIMAFTPTIHAAGVDHTGFTQVAPQFIAALGDPKAKSGNNAQTWGLWRVDPGPRGVPLTRYQRLIEVGGVAPSNWRFDSKDWWLEEHGLIMEKPTFPLAPGRYLVTGDREVTSVLTVHRPDKGQRSMTSRTWRVAQRATHQGPARMHAHRRMRPRTHFEWHQENRCLRSKGATSKTTRF
jgi:hypothetical protein